MTYCDRCGALGQTRFMLPSGLDLVLCGHHTREHELEIINQGGVEDVSFHETRDLVTV